MNAIVSTVNVCDQENLKLGSIEQVSVASVLSMAVYSEDLTTELISADTAMVFGRTGRLTGRDSAQRRPRQKDVRARQLQVRVNLTNVSGSFFVHRVKRRRCCAPNSVIEDHSSRQTHDLSLLRPRDSDMLTLQIGGDRPIPKH
jgi:hypothetical protein